MVVQVQLRPSDPHMAAYIEPGPQRWRNIDWHVLQRAAFVEIRGVSCTSYANEGRDGRGLQVSFSLSVSLIFPEERDATLTISEREKGDEMPSHLHQLVEAYRDSRLFFILDCSQRLELIIVVAAESQA